MRFSAFLARRDDDASSKLIGGATKSRRCRGEFRRHVVCPLNCVPTGTHAPYKCGKMCNRIRSGLIKMVNRKNMVRINIRGASKTKLSDQLRFLDLYFFYQVQTPMLTNRKSVRHTSNIIGNSACLSELRLL